jgi:hypothetical protein
MLINILRSRSPLPADLYFDREGGGSSLTITRVNQINDRKECLQLIVLIYHPTGAYKNYLYIFIRLHMTP